MTDLFREIIQKVLSESKDLSHEEKRKALIKAYPLPLKNWNNYKMYLTEVGVQLRKHTRR